MASCPARGPRIDWSRPNPPVTGVRHVFQPLHPLRRRARRGRPLRRGPRPGRGPALRHRRRRPRHRRQPHRGPPRPPRPVPGLRRPAARAGGPAGGGRLHLPPGFHHQAGHGLRGDAPRRPGARLPRRPGAAPHPGVPRLGQGPHPRARRALPHLRAARHAAAEHAAAPPPRRHGRVRGGRRPRPAALPAAHRLPLPEQGHPAGRRDRRARHRRAPARLRAAGDLRAPGHGAKLPRPGGLRHRGHGLVRHLHGSGRRRPPLRAELAVLARLRLPLGRHALHRARPGGPAPLHAEPRGVRGRPRVQPGRGRGHGPRPEPAAPGVPLGPGLGPARLDGVGLLRRAGLAADLRPRRRHRHRGLGRPGVGRDLRLPDQPDGRAAAPCCGGSPTPSPRAVEED